MAYDLIIKKCLGDTTVGTSSSSLSSSNSTVNSTSSSDDINVKEHTPTTKKMKSRSSSNGTILSPPAPATHSSPYSLRSKAKITSLENSNDTSNNNSRNGYKATVSDNKYFHDNSI